MFISLFEVMVLWIYAYDKPIKVRTLNMHKFLY